MAVLPSDTLDTSDTSTLVQRDTSTLAEGEERMLSVRDHNPCVPDKLNLNDFKQMLVFAQINSH